MISADHDCSAEAIDAAKSRGLRVMAVGRQRRRGRRGHSSRRCRGRGLFASACARTSRQALCGPAAAGRRIPDRERAGRRPVSPSAPAAMRPTCSRASNISKAPRAGSSASASATARRSSSTTRTSPMRWRRRCRRCGLTPSAGWSSCSAPAAIAMPASVRSWARSRLRTPTASSSPTTIRAARSRKPFAPRSSPTAKGAREIGDRAAAIRAAIEELEDGDALLVAGKGHETGQIVGGEVLPFSDHEAVAAALASRVA